MVDFSEINERYEFIVFLQTNNIITNPESIKIKAEFPNNINFNTEQITLYEFIKFNYIVDITDDIFATIAPQINFLNSRIDIFKENLNVFEDKKDSYLYLLRYYQLIELYMKDNNKLVESYTNDIVKLVEIEDHTSLLNQTLYFISKCIMIEITRYYKFTVNQKRIKEYFKENNINADYINKCYDLIKKNSHYIFNCITYDDVDELDISLFSFPIDKLKDIRNTIRHKQSFPAYIKDITELHLIECYNNDDNQMTEEMYVSNIMLGDLEDQVNTSQELLNNIKDNVNEKRDLELLNIFNDEKNNMQKHLQNGLKAFYGLLITMILLSGIAYWYLSKVNTMSFFKSLFVSPTYSAYLQDIPLLSGYVALIWIILSINKKNNMNKAILEDYKQKANIMRLHVELKKSLGEDKKDQQLHDELISQIIKTVGENPARLVEKAKSDHPINDTLELVSKTIDLKDKILNTSNKTDTKS